MKTMLAGGVRCGLVGIGLMCSVAVAAAPTKDFKASKEVKYASQMQEIAQELNLPFDAKKGVISQALDMREALHDRVATITHMSSRHTLRCKRTRRQLLEVNYLIREMRADGLVEN